MPNNASGALGRGLDIRGDGGLIIAPPSRHITGKRYRIDPDHHPEEVGLAAPPQWLLARLRAAHQRRLRREKPVRPSNGLNRYGEAALNNACRRIAAARDGQQEQTVNREAFSMGRLAGAGAVPGDFALRVLKHEAQRIASFDEHRPWRLGDLR